MKNKKKNLLILTIILIIISIFLIIYPKIELNRNNKLYLMSYSNNWEDSEDVNEIEEQLCYNESYSYNKKRDISIINWEYKVFLFFKWFDIEYKKGNICSTEYVLEESYIKHFIDKAEIKENEENINLNKLIAGKTAIVKNKKYPWNDNYKYIGYILDNEYQEMYISTNENGLLIIQVGSTDEGPKYIAYK